MDTIDKLLNKDPDELRKLYEKVVHQLDYEWGVEANLHESYSGRAMYGSTTLGISGEFEEYRLYEAFAVEIAQILDDVEDPLVDHVGAVDEMLCVMRRVFPRRQDSLGLGRIYYL